MEAVNITVEVDEKTKKEFDDFCANVGMNISTAINMFIKATLRTRELPFTITDAGTDKQKRKALEYALKAIQEQSKINGTDDMTMDEINAEIAAYRRERDAAQWLE